METGTYHIITVILVCCVLHRTKFRFSMINSADFIRQFLAMKIAVAPATENLTLFEPSNNETRQCETPEVQPHGVALPP